jgi:hypothetical protein
MHVLRRFFGKTSAAQDTMFKDEFWAKRERYQFVLNPHILRSIRFLKKSIFFLEGMLSKLVR